MRVPSKYQDLPPGVAHRQEIAERWAQGCVWQAPFSFLQAQRGRHCPLSTLLDKEARHHPKGHQKGREHPQNRKCGPWKLKNAPSLPNSFVFCFCFFFFLGGGLGVFFGHLYFFFLIHSSLCIQISRTSTVIQDRGLNILHITPGPHWIHRDNCP